MDNEDIMLNIARPRHNNDSTSGNKQADRTQDRKLKYSVKFRKENAKRGRREREFEYNLLPDKDEGKRERPAK